MALTKPIVSTVNAFDATLDKLISFTSSGGDQVVKNEISIINNNTSVEVYNNVQTTYQFNQTVPADTLTNGIYYAVRFRTYNISDETSAWSDYLPFYCYSTPTISLNVSEGATLTSASYTFMVSYDQAEDELLDYAYMELYSATNTLICRSDNLYNTATPPLTVECMFEGLVDSTSYKIKATAITVDGMTVDTGLINFSVLYTKPVISSSLLLTVNNCDGYIDVESNIIAIDGESNPTPPLYVNDVQVDMGSCCADITDETNAYFVKWEEGYTIPTNFLLRYWFTPAMINNKIVKLGNSDDSVEVDIEFIRGATLDYVTLTTTDGTVITSNGITHTNGTDLVFLWVKVVGGAWDIILESISRTTTVCEWNGASNVQMNYTTDILYMGTSYETYSIPTQVEVALSDELVHAKIGNGTAHHFNVTKDTSLTYSTTIPDWDYNTVLDCSFDNTISAGNVDIVLGQVSLLRVKRRDINSVNWVTIYEHEVTTAEDLLVNIYDSSVPAFIEQTYAIVPVLEGNIEGDYITDVITPEWNGVFLSDGTTIFKLYNAVAYDPTTLNVPNGMLVPIGATYPTVIQNSSNKYDSGGVSADLFGYTYEDTRKVDRADVVKQTNDFMIFMTNGKAKFFIDWNGYSFIIRNIGNPQRSFNQSYGNGVTRVSFTWVEQGKYYVQQDLIDNGFL